MISRFLEDVEYRKLRFKHQKSSNLHAIHFIAIFVEKTNWFNCIFDWKKKQISYFNRPFSFRGRGGYYNNRGPQNFRGGNNYRGGNNNGNFRSIRGGQGSGGPNRNAGNSQRNNQQNADQPQQTQQPQQPTIAQVVAAGNNK